MRGFRWTRPHRGPMLLPSVSGMPDSQSRQRAKRREVLAVLEIGDLVRIPRDVEVRKIVGIGPGDFVKTQLGNDASTVKQINASDLVLVNKAAKPEAKPGFLPPNRSIMG